MSIRVMADVWQYSAAKGSGLLLLLAIADFADDDGRAFPSVATLAAKTRLSERNVQYLISALVEHNELRVEQGGGRHRANIYHVTVKPTAPYSTGNTVQGLHPNAADTVQASAETVQQGVLNGATAIAPEPSVTTSANRSTHRASGPVPAPDEATMPHTVAEQQVLALLRQPRGASYIPADQLLLHLRGIWQQRGGTPPDDLYVSEALRFSEYWQTRRATTSAHQPWKGWKGAVTNWMTRVRLPQARNGKPGAGTHVDKSFAAIAEYGRLAGNE